MFCTYFKCSVETVPVKDPIGRTVLAKLCFLDDGTAVVESCQAVGFSLLTASELNPFVASSYGVGEMIRHAVDKGAREYLSPWGIPRSWIWGQECSTRSG